MFSFIGARVFALPKLRAWKETVKITTFFIKIEALKFFHFLQEDNFHQWNLDQGWYVGCNHL